MKKFFAIIILVFTCLCFAFPLTPNISTSPGALCSVADKDFSEYRYQAKIPYCIRNVSSGTKTELYDLYKIPVKERKQYTIDHIIPLSIGGSNDKKNLWPEHISLRDGRLDPDTGIKIELLIFEGLRDNTMSQQEAIDIIKKSKFNLK